MVGERAKRLGFESVGATQTEGANVNIPMMKSVPMSGRITPADVAKAPAHATLDFEHVESVSFAALRALLARGEKGELGDIVNASDDVYLMFASTGADRFVRISRAPREIDLSSYHVAGEGGMGDCYFDAEGDNMVKLYQDPSLLVLARMEKRGAYAAFVSGIPTPLVGEEVKAGDKYGIVFERAKGKKSIARLIADDPDNIEEYANVFADMFKRLHSTPCAKGLADPVEPKFRFMIDRTEILTAEQHERADAILDGIEPRGTCLHGDPHLGNMIIGDNGPQFIDLGSFSYGNPMFDLSMTYIECSLLCDLGEVSDEMITRNFHIRPATLKRFWGLFARRYFDAQTPEQVEEVEEMLAPLAWASTARILAALGPEHPHFRPIFDTLTTRLGF